MLKSILFWLLLVTTFVWGDTKGVHSVTYSVIANPPSAANNVVGVAMGKDVYALQASETVPMLYTGVGPSSIPYRYVILDSNNNIVHFEPFERPAIEQSNQTFYETYGRPWNKLTLPTIPQLYDFNTTMGHIEPLPKANNVSVADPAESRLFEEGAIATIHLEADDARVRAMHLNKMEKKAARVTGRLTYISYNDIQQFDDVELKVGGHSSRKWAKVPYKLKIPEASAPDGLYRRWEMKLRPESTDPTMMREKIYNDMLQSSGVLAARGTYVRLYINQTPVGLFLLVDDSGSESFIRETIHGGDSNVQLGPIIQGDAGKGTYAANFAYLGEDDSSYDEDVYDVKLEAVGAQPSAMESFIDFARFIKQFDPSSETDQNELLSTWQSKMDIVRYIRQLAVEWIGGNWDGVQYSGNNFALYRHPATNQLIMIPMDFDYTFGNGLEEDQRQLMTGEWTEFTANRKIHSYLWEKLKEIPYFVKLYQDNLRIMNEGWSPEILNKRVDGIAYMIERDVVWDRSLERMSGGTIRPWSGDDFLGSLEHGTGEPDEAIGLKEWMQSKYDAIKEMKDKLPGVDDMGVGQDLMPDVPIGEGQSSDAELDQEQEEPQEQEEEEPYPQDQGDGQEREPEIEQESNDAAQAQ